MLSRLSAALVALMTLHSRPAAGQVARIVPPPARPTPGPTSVSPWSPSPTPSPPWKPSPTAIPPWIPSPTPLPPTPLPAAPPTPRPTATPVPVGAVRVKVLVSGADGKLLPTADAVAWFPGLRGPAPPPQKLSSRDKRFEPRVLAVPRGTTVTFPNYDKIFHNVFSLSEASRFDLGLYRNGASRATSFDTPGVVRVFCNIHPQMAAYVVVLDGNLYSQTGKDGVALIASVPAGRQTLKVWEERGGEWSGTVVVPADGTAELTVPFDASKWREQPHKNKHGKDYPPPDDDENRY